MSLGENFTINVPKQYNFDEPACELYVVIDNESVKLLKDEKQQELMTTVYDNIKTTTHFYRVAEIEVQEDTDKRTSVSLGVSVKLDLGGRKVEYTVVGATEADPTKGKISNESPIAQALLSHKVGDVVTVDSPNGNYDVEIIEIK